MRKFGADRKSYVVNIQAIPINVTLPDWVINFMNSIGDRPDITQRCESNSK